MKPIILDFDTAIQLAEFLQDCVKGSDRLRGDIPRYAVIYNTYSYDTMAAIVRYLSKFGSIYSGTIDKAVNM